MQLIRTQATFLLAVAALAIQPMISHATTSYTTAFLGVHFQNDNEMYEPTTDAERNRLAKVEEIFKTKLAETGAYQFIEIDPEMKKRVATGQPPGECGGCEVDFGKELGTERVAWIRVQKVSNLILNMNVYIADVKANEMVFVRSVDMRGNTDESWERSIKYLLKNYLLPSVRHD